MSNALYVVKVAGEFTAATVAPCITNRQDAVTVAAPLKRGPLEDTTKPYVLECIVDAGGGMRKRWVDYVQVQPKYGLSSFEVTWGMDLETSSVGCVVEVSCMAGDVQVALIARAPKFDESATAARGNRMIKL